MGWLRREPTSFGAANETYFYGAHHMGTTCMSDDPTLGVVDPNLRVHGVDNLFIAGSSVFPGCGFSNPTFTILASPCGSPITCGRSWPRSYDRAP